MSEVTNEVVKADGNAVAKTEVNQLQYTNADSMNAAYKNAVVLSKSDLVPETYKNRPENILLAIDLASRTGFGLMQVMQNLYIVRGRPAWSGSFCMSAIKASGLYEWVKYVKVGEPGTDSEGYLVQAKDRTTGEIVNGPVVDWQTVKAYGWDKKPGSQWKMAPDLMFRYRAAAFFARTECPEVLQGVQTQEELRDTYGDEPKKQKTRITLDGVKQPEDIVVESEVE